MDYSNLSTVLNLANNGLILETMTISSEELINDGYIKLDENSLPLFEPVIKLIESMAFQQWLNSSTTKSIEKALGGTYRCMLDGRVLDADVLTQAKNSPFYRGYIRNSTEIAKQVEWDKINPKEIANTIGKAPAPNVVAIVFQAMAIATSQYYMHELNKNYESICSEIKSIKEQFMIQDASEILAGHKSISNMVNHFDSIMASDTRRHSESIKAGQIEYEALKQIERCILKLDKNFELDSKNDSVEKAESNVTGIINTLAQLKTSIYVYGMAKGLRVCFDEVDSPDEVSDYIGEINEQIELYKETVNKHLELLQKYTANSKALNKMSKKQIGGLVAVGLLAGPLAPALIAGVEVNQAIEMNNKRKSHKSNIEKQITENVSLDDIDALSSSVLFLEEYASSIDSKLEIVFDEKDYYIIPPIKKGK